jgi:hypothetical protein
LQEKPQALAEQVATPWAGSVQTVPQAPQWPRDVVRSTHDPLQLVSGEGHVVPHPVEVQIWLVAQATVQLPQVASDVRSASQPLVAAGTPLDPLP